MQSGFAYFLFFFLLILPSGLFAQEMVADTAVRLPEVRISESRLNDFGSSWKIVERKGGMAENAGNHSLGNLLSDEGLFLRSYGIGSLSTLSIRGTGSGNVSVFWNGLNLQSPMNGTVDFSLFPLGIVDEIQIQYGGSGALFGGGVAGGSVHLKNKLDYSPSVGGSAGLKAGSYNSFGQNASFHFSNGRFAIASRLYRNTAQNNFRFRNIAAAGFPFENMEHARTSRQGLLQEFGYRIKAGHEVNLRFWFQDVSREIPATMTELSSQAVQEDRSYRLSADWQLVTGKLKLESRFGLSREFIGFLDPSISLAAENYSTTILSEVEGSWHAGVHQIQLGISHVRDQAKTDNYSGAIAEDKFAGAAFWKMRNRKENFQTILAIRQELVGDKFAPLTASLGIKNRINGSFWLKANAARNYKYPTLNDRFWIPGGNPNLKAESGWSNDIGLSFQKRKGSLSIRLEGAAFSNVLINRIVWLPDNQGIWSPENVKNVWARGWEQEMQIQFPLKNWNFELGADYYLTISTNTAVGASQENSLGKQLIYEPRHKGNIQLGISIKNWKMEYFNQFTGRRFITSDNQEFLKAYQISKLRFSGNIHSRNIELKLFAELDNIWGSEYQIIAFRPMPGRNILTGLIISFNKKMSSE